MDEEIEIWFEDHLFDCGLDEYLTKLFTESEEVVESNMNNFAQHE